MVLLIVASTLPKRLLVTVGGDSVQLLERQLGQLPKGQQPFAAERKQPNGQEPPHRLFVDAAPDP
jgi:hypothetical protein